MPNYEKKNKIYFFVDNKFFSLNLKKLLLEDFYNGFPLFYFYFKIFVKNKIIPFWSYYEAFFDHLKQVFDIYLDYSQLQEDIVALYNKNIFFPAMFFKTIFYYNEVDDKFKYALLPTKFNLRNNCNINKSDLFLISRNSIKETEENEIVVGDRFYLPVFDFETFNVYRYSYIKDENTFLLIFNSQNQILQASYFNIIVIADDRTIISPTYKSGAKFNPTQLAILDYLRPKFEVKDRPLSLEDLDNALEIHLVLDPCTIYTKIGFEVRRYDNIYNSIYDDFLK